MKRMTGNLVALGLALTFVLLGAELLFRISSTPSPVFPKDAYVFDEKLGYRLSSNQNFVVGDTDFVYRVQTDSRGLRKSNVTSRVFAIGDSYTFGTGVEDEQTFASRIGAFNLGVGGYGTHQEVLMISEHLDLRPQEIILQFYNGNDVQDLLGMRTLEIVDGRLAYSESARNFGFFRRLQAFGLEHSRIFAFLSLRLRNIIGVFKYRFDTKEQTYRLAFSLSEYPKEVQERFGVVDSSFQDLEALSKEIGFHVTVLIIPNDYEVNREKFDKLLTLFKLPVDQYNQEKMGSEIGKIAIKHGFDVIDMRTFLTKEDYFPHDGHINVQGHAKVAQTILEQREQRKEISP